MARRPDSIGSGALVSVRPTQGGVIGNTGVKICLGRPLCGLENE